jgi:NAD(P)-dependent dehydrogenase (short-subunit alcohol dehydrogenase family)
MALATVRAALARGADLVAAGRCPIERREPVAGARQEVADVTDEESARALLQNAGELDHLLVTASPGSPGAFLEQDLASALTYMDGKFFGSWTCARFAAPGTRACGSITFVTGAAIVCPPARGSMIEAAFAAIEALTRALAVELGPQRVNTIPRLYRHRDAAVPARRPARRPAPARRRRAAGQEDGRTRGRRPRRRLLDDQPQVTGTVLEVTGGETLINTLE